VAVAPGKAFLCGEYAVLEGAMAVVAAVDRLAVAEIREDAPAPTDFVQAALDVMRERFGLSVPGVAVDTSAFHHGGRKLGLGSSAATVAAVSCAVWLYHGRPLARSRMTLHDAALAAHARAQDARGAAGSGADVSASIMGGLIGFQRRGASTRAVHLDAGALPTLIFVDTGTSADTAGMLASLRALRERASSRYDSAFEGLRTAASRFLTALEAGNPAEMIREFDSYGHGLHALGELAEIPIVTAAHQAVRDIARAHGGAGKPSGAGGGDLAVVLLPAATAPDALDAELAGAGLARVSLAIRDAGAGLAEAR